MDTEKKVSIKSVESLFSNLKGEHISLRKGDVLYTEKDLTDGFYLVFKGSMELIYHLDFSENYKKNISTYEFFGIEEIMESKFHNNTAKATEDTDLIKIPATNLNIQQIETTDKGTQGKTVIQKLNTQTLNTTSIEKLVNVYYIEGVTVVSLYAPRGNLTNAIQFKNILLDAIDTDKKKLIIDLLMCKTMDSTFLGSLISALKKITAGGGKLKLVCNSNVSSWLFVMTKMDKVFEIYPSLDEAVNRFEN